MDPTIPTEINENKLGLYERQTTAITEAKLLAARVTAGEEHQDDHAQGDSGWFLELVTEVAKQSLLE